METDPGRAKARYLFEMQRWMGWIFFEQIETPVGKPLNFGRKCLVCGPKPG
jgi:hypothetical protein